MSLFTWMASLYDGFFNKKLWPPQGRMRDTTAQVPVSEDSALNYSAVWCATRLMCGTASSLPLPLYRGLADETREKARTHPAYRLLNGMPNPEQTAYNWRSVMWQWQLNWGNAYAEIVREGNDPEGELVALWPLHPERVTAMRDENDTLYYEVRNNQGIKEADVDPWRILHIPSIITHDGVNGLGVIQNARESIGAAIAAEKYGANWFGGAGIPRAVIETKGKEWGAEIRKNFREEWDELYSGPSGRRIAVLPSEAKMTPLSFTAEDSQFLETRQFGVEEIARWYGIPPHLLQHLLHATYSNIEHQGIDFVQYCLIPWLKIWEQCIWQKLLTTDEQSDYFAEHNVDALLRGDHASRASFYQSMTASGLMTRNECRRKENLDPVEGGDTFLVQGAIVPLDNEGRPESKFVNGSADTTAPQQDTTVVQPGDQPADQPSQILASVSARLHRIISSDLSRLLTKETKAVAGFARDPRAFGASLDEFYLKHATMLRDELTESLHALAECGLAVDAESFITAWVEEGRKLAVEASGRASNAEELKLAIQSTMESRTWKERPARAVESVKGVVA